MRTKINIRLSTAVSKSRFLCFAITASLAVSVIGLALLTSTTIGASPTSGRQIFLGQQPLKNGGPACISCHTISGIGAVGGGNLAKDLTNSYSTLTEAALVPILKTTPFPIMRDVYKTKPLTDDEISALVAFFKEADSTKTTTPAQNPAAFFITGIIVFLAVIGLFQLIWRGRLSGVRQPLVKGGSK